MPWTAAIPTVASAVGSMIGGRSQNRRQRDMAREAMAFERESQQLQMDFQERMSSSAYQRAMQDMRQAGLNPMLAFSQGGASTPSGGGASGHQASQHDTLSPAVSSAQQTRMLAEQLRQMRAQRREIEARARTTEAQAQWQEAYNHAFNEAGIDSQGRMYVTHGLPRVKELVDAEISSARSRAMLDSLRIPEQQAMATMWDMIGGGGAAARTFLPQLLRLFTSPFSIGGSARRFPRIGRFRRPSPAPPDLPWP